MKFKVRAQYEINNQSWPINKYSKFISTQNFKLLYFFLTQDTLKWQGIHKGRYSGILLLFFLT